MEGTPRGHLCVGLGCFFLTVSCHLGRIQWPSWGIFQVPAETFRAQHSTLTSDWDGRCLQDPLKVITLDLF